jgi:uncharacterized membrane protein
VNTPSLMDSIAAGRPLPGAARAHPAPGLGGVECREEAESSVIVVRANCALAPRQLLAAFALAMGLSMLIALGFLAAGAPWILPFSCLELGLLALALFWVVRHAVDRETVTVSAREVLVETRVGARTRRVAFDRAWLQVQDEGDRIALRGHGRHATIGRALAWPARRELARVLDGVLRRRPAARST